MNWREIVEKYRDKIINDTVEFIGIPSKNDETNATTKAPYGPALKDALDYIMDKAKKDGFVTKEYDGHAGRLEYGTKGDVIGVVCHLDVVPEQKEGWDSEPYKGVVRDGAIYGRGSNDNKGPTIAVYYALRALIDQGLKPKNTLHMIFGCDEETKMRCMDYYKEHTDVMPVRGFVPDATFPINYGEEGIATLIMKCALPSSITSFKAGEHAHIVAQDAYATIKNAPGNVEELFTFFLVQQNLRGEIEKKDDEYNIHIQGIAAHGSRPFQGKNAACALLSFLGACLSAEKVTEISRLIENWQGRGFDIQYKSMKTGELTLCVGNVELINNVLNCTIDIRYPVDVDFEKMVDKMIAKGISIDKNFEILVEENRLGSFEDPTTPYIVKLEEIYRKHSNDEKTPMKVSAGDTYARKFDGLVTYGPTTSEHLKMKHIGQAHMPNEGMDIETLMMGCAIYAEALAYLLDCE